MFKKINKKGFTLAELLIVVAIIGVLVAISIPIFTAQLNKAKYAADEANARSVYAEMVADYLLNESKGQSTSFKVDPTSVTANNNKQTVTVTNGDGSTSTFSFSGIVGITFTGGSSSAYPSVVLADCDAAGAAEVTFGAGTPASETP